MTRKDLSYIFLDGDSIGDKVELYLLNEDIGGAVLLQSAIQSTMQVLRAQITENEEFEMLMYGCDELLFSARTSSINTIFLDEIRKVFYYRTGCTMSGGIGTSLRQALENLRRAKLSGKNKIVGLEKLLNERTNISS